MGNIQEYFLRNDRSSHSPICGHADFLHPLGQDRDVWKMPTGLSQEDSLSLAGLNQRDLPTWFQHCEGNPWEAGARTKVQHGSLALGARDMGSEKERLAVMPDHHLRPGFDGSQIHPLIPANQEFVVSVELDDF
jgi:hypothetical protein